jgi:hypothetical protein
LAGEYCSRAWASKFGEIVGGFVEHDLAFGIDAMLEGVVAGCGLARR